MSRLQRRIIPNLDAMAGARIRDARENAEGRASDIANTIMHTEGRRFETACLVGTDSEIEAAAENLRDAIKRALMQPDRRSGCGND